MRTLARILLLTLAATATSGCVFVVAPNWFDRDPALRETVVEGEGDAKVLIVSVDGFISDKPTERAFGLVREESTLARVAAELDKAEKDDDIAAVVLRVDSPGGAVTASDEIYDRLRRFAEARDVPLVATMGNVATSGAYYIALAADDILAHPTTVTGSIGVILVGVNASGLLAKLGVENETYTSGPHKDLLSPLRGATPEEREIVQGVLDDLFGRFVTVVDRRRPGLDDDRRDAIVDGRIFSAERALELGLVDRIGRLDDAVELAKKRAGVDRARVVMYHRQGEPAETVYSRFAPEPRSAGGPAAGMLPAPAGTLESLTSPQFLYLWRPGLDG